jgi:hypothetical protein
MKDARGAYGMRAREMINWLNQLQHTMRNERPSSSQSWKRSFDE